MDKKHELPTLQRLVALKALVGSHNYNLNTEVSDLDYKIFVLPEFDDLYDRQFFSTPNIVTQEVDYDIHDIRAIPQLLRGANINYLEVLFSVDIEFPSFKSVPTQLGELLSMRDVLARMNLPKFFAACLGTHTKKMGMLTKGTSSTQSLVEKFGYDTKQACHAYRVLAVAERYYRNGFNNFKDAIRYDNSEPERSLLLAIKAGEMGKSQFEVMVSEKRKRVLSLEKHFMVNLNEYAMAHVNFLIKDLVCKYIKGEYKCSLG